MISILLSPDYCQRLDPSYQKCILDLEKELNETLWYDNGIKSEIIDKFSDKYLMPKEIWDKRIDMQSLDVRNDPKTEYKKIKEKALTHFYSKRRHPRYYCDPNRKLLKANFIPAINSLNDELAENVHGLEGKNDEDKIDQKFINYCLTFPHWRLEECFKEFDEISTSPIPRHVIKRYKIVKKLFDKINLSKDDLNQWFLRLLESEDEEFIVHNIEYRLGTDLTNKYLWKAYIKYLKECNKYHDMLNVYSKYCRFFLDDHKMLRKYHNLLQKHKNDAIIVHVGDPSLKTFINKQSYHLQACRKSLHQNIFPQSFNYPSTFIRYLLDNADPYLLRNFYQTCKYLFHIHLKPLCHQLYIRQRRINVTEKIVFKGHSLDITVECIKPKILKKIYITNCLIFAYISPRHSSSLSHLISNLYRCDARFLKIYGHNLTFDEFNFLIGHGNVKYLLLYNVKITYTNNLVISMEDILSLTPKIYYFKLLRSYVSINSKTVEIISPLTFENQFELFWICVSSGEAEPYKFCEFLKKNLKEDGKICIKFQNPNPLYFFNFTKIFTGNSWFRYLKIE